MNRPRARDWWIGVPLGVLLLAALPLILLDLFDRRLAAGPLAARVEAATGRALSFDDVDLRWEWPPRLHGRELRFANARWGSEAPMLRAPEVSVSLGPVELLDGPPYVHIALREPVLLLERSAEGRWNWEFESAPREPGPPRLPVTLSVRGGRVLYRGGEGAQPFAADLQSLALTCPPGSGGGEAAAFALRASSGGLPIEAEGSLAFPPGGWRGEARLRAGDSRAIASFTLELSDATPQLRAALEGEVLAPAQLAALFPGSAQADGADSVPLPRLQGMGAEVEIGLATLRLPGLNIDDLRARFTLQDGRLELAPLEGRLDEANFQVSASLDTTASNPALRLDAALPQISLAALPASLRLAGQPGQVRASLEASVRMPDRRLPLSLDALLARLALPQGRLVYSRNGAQLTALASVQPPGGEPAVDLRVQGMDLPPLELTLMAPPLRDLAGQGAYPLELALQSAEARANLRAELGELLRQDGFSLSFSASGEALPSLPAFGFTPPPVPQFAVSGRLRHQGSRWAVNDLALAYGDNRLRGSAAYDTGGPRPQVTLDMEAPSLDLTALPGRGDAQGETAEAEENAGSDSPWIPDSVGGALRELDARADVRVGRLRVSDEQVFEDVSVDAALREGMLAVDNFGFDAGGGRVGGSLTANAARSPVDGQLSLRLEGLRMGQLASTAAPLEERLGRLSGELRLAFAEIPPGQAAQGEVLLPTLGRLSLDGSRLRFHDDAADTDFTLRFSTQGLQAGDERQRLLLQGEGRYRGQPLDLQLTGDRLLALRDPERPYDLSLDLVLGSLDAQLEGRVARPWAPRSARFDFDIRGAGTGGLESLLGRVLPSPLPDYALAGSLAWDGERLSFGGLSGDFGESDVSGEFSFNPEAPVFSADLRANHLDLDQLGALFGEEAEDSGGGETVAARDTLLPRERFDMSALRRTSLDVNLTAETTDVAALELGNFTANVRMQDGRLHAEPVSFDVAGGRLRLRLDMQARESRLEGLIEAEARSVDLSDMLADRGLPADSFGSIGGQAKLWMRGDSIGSMLGSADGGVMLLMTGGALDALLVEAAGLDLGESLLAASGLAERVPIDCAYASALSESGVVEVERFVVDTADTTFFVDGSLNLREETLDLTLYPESKDLGYPAADTPLEITGTFLEPKIGVLTGSLATRALEALALGSLAGPAAALLPFLELGAQDEPPLCRGWVESLREASRES